MATGVAVSTERVINYFTNYENSYIQISNPKYNIQILIFFYIVL